MKRWQVIAVAVVVALGMAVIAGYRMGVRILQARIVDALVPDLRTLFSDQIRISSIVVDKPYLSMLRNPGKLIMVPSLTEKEKQAKAADSESGAARALTISTIELKGGSLDLYDATVSRPPLK